MSEIGEAVKATDLITKSELAKRLGCVPSYVTKLGKQGRLVMVDGKVDYPATMARLQTTANAVRQITHDTTTPAGAAPLMGRSSQGGAGAVGDPVTRADYQQAVALDKREQAALRRIKRLKEEGQLIDVEDVEEAWHQTVRQTRDAVLAIAHAVAPELVGVRDEGVIRERIAHHAQRALQGLSDGWRPRQAA